MRENIGARTLQRARPRARPYEIRDKRLAGFLLRVQPSGVRTYYLEYAHGNRVKLGRAGEFKPDLTPERARRLAERIRGEVADGQDPAAARRRAKADTLESFIDSAYRPWAEANIRTAEATVARLKANFAELLDKKLGEITPWQIEKWRSARTKEGIKASTLNRAIDDLRSSLNKAVAWSLLEKNPIASVKRARVDTMRPPRFLSKDEELRLRAALDDREERARQHRDTANRWRAERSYELLPSLRELPFVDRLKPLTLLSLNTGARRGELFKLAWADVQITINDDGAAHGLVTIRGPKAKSGTTRHIPLNAEAAKTLAAWRRQAAGVDGVRPNDPSPASAALEHWHTEAARSGRLVFPNTKGRPLNNVRRSWEGALRVAKISGFRWHDMRHTFASNLVMAGENLNTVRELLGHSDYKMTLRYAHLAPDHKAAAVAKLVRA